MGIKRGSNAISQRTDITEDEAALYDRQIRLWGLESQKRLRNSKILIVGLGGLGAEVAKNIVLAGVKSITLLDEKKITANDRSSQFLVVEAECGKSRAEEARVKVHQLNPNVEVICDSESVDEKPDDYFTQFSVVTASDCSPIVLHRLNKICREHEICFFCGNTWGLHGYCFVDLGSHTYLATPATGDVKSVAAEDGKPGAAGDGEPAAKKSHIQEFETVKYGSLEKALAIKSGKAGIGLHKRTSKIFFLVHLLLKFREVHKRFPEPQHRKDDVEALTSLRTSVMSRLGFDEDKITLEDLSTVFGEMSAVCAVVGGVLSQEIIKAVCADQQPIQNFFLFNGDTCLGTVECIG